MTIAVAKLYKTASVIEDFEGYKAGQIVAVNFLGASGGLFRFQVTANNKGDNPICMNDLQLDHFVL